MPSPSDGKCPGGGVWRGVIIVTLVAGFASDTAVADERIRTGFALGGTTGLVNIPTADVLPDRTVRLGFGVVDEKWAYVGRGAMNNEIYFLSLGFLPRLEVTLRATVLPGIELLEGDDTPVVDRMASARFQALKGGWGPSVAFGVDDVRGTRLYHSLYVVGSQSIRAVGQVALRISGGYASTALDAHNHTLDGFFGGVEIQLWSRLRSHGSIMIDSDTEKVNAGARFTLFDRVSLHLAFLHLDTVSGGVGWTQFL